MKRRTWPRTWQAGSGKTWRPGLGLLAALLLSACATGPYPAVESPGETGLAAEEAEGPTVVPSRADAEPIDPTGPTPPQLVALRAALTVEPPIEDDPKTLLGLDRGALSELLGQPRQVRRERPAEIWQYVGNDCIFDIFLYEEKGGYRVIHAEARDNEVPLKTEPRACLNQLLRARLQDPLS